MFRFLNVMPKDEALKILSLVQPFDTDELRSAFRAQSLKTHPDMGGSNEAFRKSKEAYDVLKPFAVKKEKTVESDPNKPCNCIEQGVKAMMTCKRCAKIEVVQPALKIKRKQVVITDNKRERINKLADLIKGNKVETPKEPIPEEKAQEKRKIHVEELHVHLCPECGTDWECKDEKCDKKKVKTEEKCKNQA